MADDDEVDILGDFSLDALFPKEDSRLHCYDASVLGAQSSDLLHEYMAPQWLLDTTQPWYSTDDKSRVTSDRLLPEDRQNSFSFSSLTGVESPTKISPGTSRWDDQDSSWTEREKSLLSKGMETFGRSWNKIAQLIGTKTPSQVKNYVKWERSNRSDEGIVIEENVSSGFDQQPGEVFSCSEIIDDMQIPASMEEVIAVVSTGSPTIPVSLSCIGDIGERRKETSKSNVWNGRHSFSKGPVSKKQDHVQDVEERKKKEKKKRFPANIAEERMRLTFEKIESDPSKKREVKTKASASKLGKCLNKDADFKIEVGGARDPPRLPENLSFGEEVVRISKEGSGSDDSEIEVGDDEPLIVDVKCSAIKNEITYQNDVTPPDGSSSEVMDAVSAVKVIFNPLSDTFAERSENEGLKTKEAKQDRKEKSSSHQDIMESIAAIKPPEKEYYPDMQTISEEEKLIHTEFFEGRSTKTPKRYLKIRNHILECWYNSRPQYVTKTSVRAGLRNCGDVNCIGRIHAYLEQIGAINYGCEQARYLRPQLPTSPSSSTVPVEREDQFETLRGPTREEISARHQARIEAMRPRKRKGMNLIASLDIIDGGYTIIHNENGDGGNDDDVIAVFNGASCSSKKFVQSNRGGLDKSKLKLLRCHQYAGKHQAPFLLEVYLEALLVVDLHAHLLKSEVAGLLGGYLKHSSESSSREGNFNILKVCRAIPCQSSSSNVGCDICPVSQTEALEALEGEGLELVGWYHSHPTFPPLPSVQDVETQIRVQDWFTRSNGSPFIGLILSPHSSMNLSLASSYRCILIDDKEEIKKVPFELDVSLRSLETSGPCLSYLKNVITLISKDSSNKVNLDDVLESIHVQCINLHKKILESARILLESGKPQLQYSVQVDIVSGLEKLLNELTNLSSEDNVESH